MKLFYLLRNASKISMMFSACYLCHESSASFKLLINLKNCSSGFQHFILNLVKSFDQETWTESKWTLIITTSSSSDARKWGPKVRNNFLSLLLTAPPLPAQSAGSCMHRTCWRLDIDGWWIYQQLYLNPHWPWSSSRSVIDVDMVWKDFLFKFLTMHFVIQILVLKVSNKPFVCILLAEDLKVWLWLVAERVRPEVVEVELW